MIHAREPSKRASIPPALGEPTPRATDSRHRVSHLALLRCPTLLLLAVVLHTAPVLVLWFAVAGACAAQPQAGVVGDAGEPIRVGADAVTRVVEVDHGTNTLTVSPPIAWRQGDSVVLAYQDALPDIGAFEFSRDYSYDVALEPPAATDLGTRPITATVAQPENVRFVTFYVDNLPVGTDATAPFTCDWTPTRRGAEYHLTATAYSRFASRQPSKSVSAVYTYPGE